MKDGRETFSSPQPHKLLFVYVSRPPIPEEFNQGAHALVRENRRHLTLISVSGCEPHVLLSDENSPNIPLIAHLVCFLICIKNDICHSEWETEFGGCFWNMWKRPK